MLYMVLIRVGLPRGLRRPTVNDLFSAQCAKQSLFLFNICWEKIPF